MHEERGTTAVEAVAGAEQSSRVPQRQTGTARSALLLLAPVIALAAVLRFTDLDRLGLGSLFYASAIRSMGLSWHNFFFAAYDPLATFSIDKPPLALWLQTLCTKLFGYSGWSTIGPTALASTLAVPALYVAARHAFAPTVALFAALVLALFPESVATARDSTMDALMMALLVVAALVLQQAVRRASRVWLLTWAVVMGLVFNVKYLEGFLALPAFALYVLLCWPRSWWTRIRELAFAGTILLLVSLSWATVVELTPPEARPRIMNDPSNSVYGLIVGYNGLDRVLHREVVIFSPVPGSDNDAARQAAALRFGVGDAGPLRMFTSANGPLLGVTTLLALMGSIMVCRDDRWWRTARLMWLVWGLTGIAVFTFANRAPAHYVEAFAPALAALAAVALSSLLELAQKRPYLWAGGLLVLAGYGLLVALPFEGLRMGAIGAGGVSLLAAAMGLALAWRTRRVGSFPALLGTCGLLLSLAVPSVWIALFAPRGGQITTPNPLFYAGQVPPPSPRQVPIEEALAWIGDTRGTRYALAIDGFNNAGEAIAISGAAILPFWNEYLRQPLFAPPELQAMVADGEVRYVLVSAQRLATLLGDYRDWLQGYCANVSRPARMPRGWTLWDCAPQRA